MLVCRALEGWVCPLIRHPNLMSLKGGCGVGRFRWWMEKKRGNHLGLEVLGRSPGVVKMGHIIGRFCNRASRHTSSRLSFWKVFKSPIYPNYCQDLTFYSLSVLYIKISWLSAELIDRDETSCLCSYKTVSAQMKGNKRKKDFSGIFFTNNFFFTRQKPNVRAWVRCCRAHSRWNIKSRSVFTTMRRWSSDFSFFKCWATCCLP